MGHLFSAAKTNAIAFNQKRRESGANISVVKTGQKFITASGKNKGPRRPIKARENLVKSFLKEGLWCTIGKFESFLK